MLGSSRRLLLSLWCLPRILSERSFCPTSCWAWLGACTHATAHAPARVSAPPPGAGGDVPVRAACACPRCVSAGQRVRSLAAAATEADWSVPAGASELPVLCSAPGGAPPTRCGSPASPPEHRHHTCGHEGPSTRVCVCVCETTSPLSSLLPLFRLATSILRLRLSTSAECSLWLKSRKCCWRAEPNI